MMFIFSAFKGFHFWYAGFVFFFWLALASINYRHKTTLWQFKNRTKALLIFYLVLFIVGFVGDYIVGQKMANLWTYPHYKNLGDWSRLYLIIYPFGGFTIIELIYFLSALFHERFKTLAHTKSHWSFILYLLCYSTDLLVILAVLIFPVFSYLQIHLPFQHLFVYLFISWIIIGTLMVIYHTKHGIHWLGILVGTVVLSILFHEFPNTSVFEWKYQQAPLLNQLIFDIPLWIFLGWYLVILLMFRLWLHFNSSQRIRGFE